MSEIKITEEMYQADVSVLIGGTVEDMNNLITVRHRTMVAYSWDLPTDITDNTTNGYQFHINSPLGTDERFYIWVAEPTPYLLAHELFHLVGDIMCTRGIKYCTESEEAFAYLAGRLAELLEPELAKTP